LVGVDPVHNLSSLARSTKVNINMTDRQVMTNALAKSQRRGSAGLPGPPDRVWIPKCCALVEDFHTVFTRFEIFGTSHSCYAENFDIRFRSKIRRPPNDPDGPS
jgi:hypothetical protein